MDRAGRVLVALNSAPAFAGRVLARLPVLALRPLLRFAATFAGAPHAAPRRRGRFLPARGYGSFGAIAVFGALGLAGASHGGHIDAFRAAYGGPGDLVAGWIGLRIGKVSITGAKELRPEEVVAAIGLSPNASLPFLDVAGVQQRLASVPLIAKASVTKLYPDRLAITIEERVPFALWQKDGVVKVVAADGTVIDVLNDARFLRLPHVVGTGANLRAAEFAAILAEVPEMADQVKAGTLIAERRWNITLKNGVELRLPELGWESALRRFVALDRDARVSERDVLAIDLRIPGKAFVRLTEEAAEGRRQMLEAKSKSKGRG